MVSGNAVAVAVRKAAVRKALGTRVGILGKPEEAVHLQKDIHSTAFFGGNTSDPLDAQADNDRRQELIHAYHDALVETAGVAKDCTSAHCKNEATSVPSTSKTNLTLLSDQQAFRGG